MRVMFSLRRRLITSGDERRSRLEGNVLMWAIVVQRVTPRLSATGMTEQIAAVLTGGRTAEELLGDAHLLTIGIPPRPDQANVLNPDTAVGQTALMHIEQHLQYLKGMGFRTRKIAHAAKQFFAAYDSADVKDLRDLLEHQADYLAGKGWKPDLVNDLNQPVSIECDALGTDVWVYVFGKQCRVDPIVRVVATLEAALREA